MGQGFINILPVPWNHIQYSVTQLSAVFYCVYYANHAERLSQLLQCNYSISLKSSQGNFSAFGLRAPGCLQRDGLTSLAQKNPSVSYHIEENPVPPYFGQIGVTSDEPFPETDENKHN